MNGIGPVVKSSLSGRSIFDLTVRWYVPNLLCF
jgi:hypothetical protein